MWSQDLQLKFEIFVICDLTMGMNDIVYFGYGSNMDFAALRAKGVKPRASRQACLPGWRLRFNVAHFFKHEGGVGNIEYTGLATDVVHGVLHICDETDLAALDKLEGEGVGYDRISVEVTSENTTVVAHAYIGCSAYINENLLPVARYMNILVRGARAAKISSDYIAKLEKQPIFKPAAYDCFVPKSDAVVRDYTSLAPQETVLAGHVFCMGQVRFEHELARDWFGGKEVTQFHLRRSDRSNGEEQLHSFLEDNLRSDQRVMLNTYLNAFDEEYVHLGRFDYDRLPVEKILV